MGRLKMVAERILERSLTRDWRPTTWDIEREYRLDQRQVQTVKRYVKKMAADQGHIWAYDPELNYYWVVPDKKPLIAARVLSYAVKHHRDSGKSLVYLFEGAYRQGYIPKSVRGDLALGIELENVLLRKVQKTVKRRNVRRTYRAASLSRAA